MARPTTPVAAAPCSFGVFELGDSRVEPEWMLDVVAAAGYDGIDLGPPGYLGEGAVLRDRLTERGLRLAGGWIQLAEDDTGFTVLHRALDCFDAAGGPDGPLGPRPTLAVDGPGALLAGARMDLDDAGWSALIERIDAAAGAARARGYAPTFHHHIGTWVETPAQIRRLLGGTADAGVGFCLDTGHLLLGGGDVAEALDAWAPRINHVHLKDVHLDQAKGLAAAQAPIEEVWRTGLFCPLGAGDLDVDGILDALDDFAGWLVIEQDVLLPAGADATTAADDQRHNRRYLQERGW